MNEQENNTAPVLSEIKFPVSMGEIDNLLVEYKDIPAIDPESDEAGEQYQFVLAGHKKFIKARTSIEKVRKSLKAPAIDYGKKVDELAKEFQSKISSTEASLKNAREAVERHEQEKMFQAEEAERLRVMKNETIIKTLQNVPLDFIDSSSQEIDVYLNSITAPTVEELEEFYDRAIEAYNKTVAQLKGMVGTKTKAEQADKLEAERQAQIQKEDDERKAKFEAEQADFKRKQEEFKKQQEVQSENLRLQQEEINRQRAENEAEELQKRQEVERIEREKQEANEKKRKEREDKKLFEKRQHEANKAIGANQVGLLNAIINGEIPHVKWMPDE